MAKAGYDAVVQLLREHPEWLPVVTAALEEAETIKSDRFAGAWVLERAKKHGVVWIPNLRKLVAFGILKKEGESSRGGRRSYYSMPDTIGVRKAIDEFDSTHKTLPYEGHEVTEMGVSKRKEVLVPMFANLASCGSPNLSEGHVDDYREVSTELAVPGFKYFLVRADGDSMNRAGINSGDLLLVRVQEYANIGDRVVACIDGDVVVKEFQRQANSVLLMPRSDNPEYKPLLVDSVQIQGVVVATIPHQPI